MVKVKVAPLKVRKEDQGIYRVEGGGVENLVRRVDLSTAEGRIYVQRKLKKAGVERELLKAGAEEGDLIKIGDEEFVFYPSS